jgi:membrane protein YqaA with SNARE-associated domain
VLKALYLWTIGWADGPYGVPALFFLAFAEASFFPLPPDVLLIALGLGRPENALWYAAVCTAGSTIGGMLGYGIGRVGGRPLLDRFVAREKTLRIHRAFERYEAWAIGIAGFTPIPYKVFTISAGAFWINFPRFVLASLLSRGARFFLVGTLIMLYGEQVRHLIERYFNWFTILFVALLGGGFWLVHRHGRKVAAGGDEGPA